MKKIIESANLLQNELVAIRRKIHACPEVGASLPETKRFVMKKLREFGYEPKEICESGIVATISGNQHGKTIMLRADMDALSIKEESGLAFSSCNDNMHACGHDMHTTMLLGAAKLLKQYQSLIKGRVKLVFQPDEEGFTGAKEMMKAGVLENPKVDAGMAFHVHSSTPTGMILCGKGTCMASCNLFRIQVKGTGCHGAMPETGVDPINIATHIYLSLQEIIAREISAMKSATLTIGKFSGGTAPNIIPEEVVLEGTIRSLDKDLSEYIFQRITEISKQTAAMFRGDVEVVEIASAPPLYNNEAMVDRISNYLKEVIDPKKVIVYEGGGMGSEDFSSFTYEIPCCYLLLGAGSSNENELYGKPMHNDHVVFNEDILSYGSALFVISALRWLNEQE